MLDKVKHIKRKIKIPKLRLWFIWFFLFVLPCIFALVGFEYFYNKKAFFEKTDLIYKAFEDIKKYNEIIAPENFLEEQIDEIKKLDASLPLEILKQEIDKKLCGESLFCLFFDSNVEKLTNLKSNNIPANLKNLPINFLKKQIKNLKEKEFHEGEKETDFLEEKETNIQFATLLQQLFKTSTNISIHLNKVSKNFSVKYDGELYFIICNFDKPSEDCFGFFAVIQGKNFDFHKMLERLNADFPEIRIIFREVDINKNEINPEIFHSGIRQDKEGLHIIAPTSAKFVRHVLHGGTAKLNKKYGNLFPFLDYYIPLWEYWEKGNKTISIIRLITIIIILLSGIYFLNVSLFGFSDKMTFKNKIISLLLIATIFPFGIFTLGWYSKNESEKLINKIQIQNYVESKFEKYSQELDDYKGKIEASLLNSSQIISSLITDKKIKGNEIVNYFNSIGENLPISTAILYFDPPPEKLVNLCKENKIDKEYLDRVSKSQGGYNKDPFTKTYLEMTLGFAKEVKLSSRVAQNHLNVLGKKYRSEIINDFLKDEGKFMAISRKNTIYYFTLNRIYDYTKGKELIGLLTTNLEPKPILKAFLSESKNQPNSKTIIAQTLARNGYTEQKDNYNINYAFIPLENSGDAGSWNGCGNIDSDDKKLCLQNTSSGRIDKGNKIFIKRRNQSIPHLAIATIKEADGDNKTIIIIKLLLIVAAYLSLILYFSNILLNLLIVNPVLLLASNASAIAKGSDKWETEIKSGDEFEELNNSFKQLVTSLKERNILKSYVSEDAFADIEGSDNLKLLPGGEYLETTIVFSAIKDYDKLSSSVSPKESIKMLSNFMSIADDSAKKYGGSIDKIIGDTLMLVFRKNSSNKESHALRAAKASLELVEKAKSIGFPHLYTGIASGQVISGKIGSYTGKLDFTVIGNPVNSASRFKTESKNGTTETGIIISGTTIGLTKGKARVKFLRRVSIKGKARKYNIYELIGIRD